MYDDIIGGGSGISEPLLTPLVGAERTKPSRTGSPLPGFLFVLQPTAAIEAVREKASRAREILRPAKFLSFSCLAIMSPFETWRETDGY
ncbi:MAG TPA: hypothetical protein VF787_25475 [Thermoanaerobaculia bacterium]